jgi:hypothetical protein
LPAWFIELAEDSDGVLTVNERLERVEQRTLERVTASDGDALRELSELDAESAEMRDGWLLLTGLLQAADAAAAPVIVVVPPVMRLVIPRVDDRRPSERLPQNRLRGSLIPAISLTVLWGAIQFGLVLAPSSKPASLSSVSPVSPIPVAGGPADRLPAPLPAPNEESWAGAEQANRWQDTWEDELERVTRAIQQWPQQRSAADQSLLTLQAAVQELAKEFETSAL